MNHAYAVIRCFVRQRILRLYPLPIEIYKYPDINIFTHGEDESYGPVHLQRSDQLCIEFSIRTDDGLILTKRNLDIDYCSKDADTIEINLTKMYLKISQLIPISIDKPMEDAIKELMKLEELGIIETDKKYCVYYIKEE